MQVESKLRGVEASAGEEAKSKVLTQGEKDRLESL